MSSSPEEIERAARLIRAGRLVAFPTETVYGLGANALDPEAVARIFAAKERPRTSPLIVHAASTEMAQQIVRRWPEAARLLAERFWPGPLTLVLPKSPEIPDLVSAGLPTVGVRVPAHPVALALLKAAGVPIAAPSANRFTELSPTSAEHVRVSLGERVDMVLDGGNTDVGIESTVLSLAGAPTLLRPGMIQREEIERLIGPVATAMKAGEGPHASPGMHERHYSPRTRLVLGRPAGGRFAWIYRNNPEPTAARHVRMPADPEAYARVLYATLYELDKESWECLAVEPVPTDPGWAGIADRLARASQGAEMA